MSSCRDSRIHNSSAQVNEVIEKKNVNNVPSFKNTLRTNRKISPPGTAQRTLSMTITRSNKKYFAQMRSVAAYSDTKHVIRTSDIRFDQLIMRQTFLSQQSSGVTSSWVAWPLQWQKFHAARMLQTCWPFFKNPSQHIPTSPLYGNTITVFRAYVRTNPSKSASQTNSRLYAANLPSRFAYFFTFKSNFS